MTYFNFNGLIVIVSWFILYNNSFALSDEERYILIKKTANDMRLEELLEKRDALSKELENIDRLILAREILKEAKTKEDLDKAEENLNVVKNQVLVKSFSGNANNNNMKNLSDFVSKVVESKSSLDSIDESLRNNETLLLSLKNELYELMKSSLTKEKFDCFNKEYSNINSMDEFFSVFLKYTVKSEPSETNPKAPLKAGK